MRCIGISLFLSLSIVTLCAQDEDADNNTRDAANDLLGADFANMPAMPNSIRIEHDGTIELDSEAGTILFSGKQVNISGDNGIMLKASRALVNSKKETATLTGQVSVRQKSVRNPDGTITSGIQLFADTVILDSKKKTVTLTGNVSIYQGQTLHRGKHAVYHYGSRILDTEGLASGLGPIMLESDRFTMHERNGRKVFVGDNAGITTHDVSKPNFWLRSDRTTIYPNDRIIFNNLRIYAGDTAVFWLPYLSQPLDADLGYHFIPGARTNWGFFLLNRYGIMLGGEVDKETGARENAWLLSQWHFDIRSRRGLGLGLDLIDSRLANNPNLGWLKLYYLNDLSPSIERSAESRGFVNEDRWKFELQHRIVLRKHDNQQTLLDFDITALSDRFFLEDFEPGTFRINPNPDNEVGIFHHHPNFLAGIYARLRLNDFYQTDTRLPELFIDQVKRPIFGSPILHEGTTSFGVYDEHLPNFEENNLKAEAALLPLADPRRSEIMDLLADRGFTRFHTFHEFTLPLNQGSKIAITPRAGFGHTRYSNIDGANSFHRTHLSAGVDASMKFTRVYPDAVSEQWGVNGLLHIFQPYVNFSQLSTNELDSSFTGIETLTPSTRPRPLEVGRFTARDDLTDWSIVRLGGQNRLMTKRDGDTHEWLVMDTYVDVFLNDPEFDRKISNLYNDIIWHPIPWMQLSLETQFPIADSQSEFRELAGSIRLMPTESFEISLGYRQLNNHPILEDSNQVTIRAYSRISESWGIGFYQRWELDEGNLAVQQYSLYHDFDSWTASVGLLVRDNNNQRDEFGLMLNFTLKDFPSVRLPLSVDNE
ncbi:MAG: LPS-assembly protein LptD [Akkermansiaceae bacterium]